jgi:regulator of sirC expression with transglutaminase-like and TPR domain
MARPDDQIPLDEAALLIAAHADPGIDVGAQLARLDDLAARVAPADTDGLCHLVFDVLGLRGDGETYDDPRNSSLPQVLDRRLGIPITLSVLLIEIGRRRGVALEGVGMPGHFLVRDPARPELLIDAFSAGRRLDRDQCAGLLAALAGQPVELRADMLAAAGPRAILARMLANLDNSFRRRRDQSGRRWAARLEAAIPGLPASRQLALADSLAGLGCPTEAATLLEAVAGRPGVPPEAARSLRTRARGLSAPLN